MFQADQDFSDMVGKEETWVLESGKTKRDEILVSHNRTIDRLLYSILDRCGPLSDWI
jgi:hypothetical protein